MPAEASPLKVKIQDSVKEAMRAKDKVRLGTLRQITASIKQVEVDKRVDLGDEDIITIMTKMCKQRRDSISQFEEAGRTDLSEIEVAELAIIEEFMPKALSSDEITKATSRCDWPERNGTCDELVETTNARSSGHGCCKQLGQGRTQFITHFGSPVLALDLI